MKHTGALGPTGGIGLATRRHLGDLRVLPPPPGWQWRNWLHYRRALPKRAAARFFGRLPGVMTSQATLRGAVYRANFAILAPWQAHRLRDLLAQNVNVLALPRHFGGQVTQYGVLSTRVVTTAGVNFIVDAFQNLVEVENMKFHGFGTGTNAEAAGDTALQTELTTQYAVDNTRPTGTTTEGASANIYRTVATLSPDSGGTIAITEHGVCSASSGTVLLDRSVFSAVNLVAGSDSLQATYELTFASGG
jgi:hypothetical protein